MLRDDVLLHLLDRVEQDRLAQRRDEVPPLDIPAQQALRRRIGCKDPLVRRDQHRRHGQDHTADEDGDEVRWEPARVQVPSHHHRHRQFHQLGRLEAQHPQVEPALRSFADISTYKHESQQNDAEQIQPG